MQGILILEVIERKDRIKYPAYPSDIHYDTTKLILLPCLAFIMGLLATGLGIGGGLIIGPILVQMIKHPLISTSTSNLLVVFTSSSSTIQFAIMGKLNLSYSVWCLIAAVIGSVLGSFTINWIVKLTGRASYIIFILSLVCLLSTVLVPLNSIFTFINRVNRGFSLFETGTICE